MLAYVFWHRPAPGEDRERYEHALSAFHASLAPPSSAFRVDAAEAPWLPGAGPVYEDWYRVEDWTALGALNATAVDAAHKAPHDAVAHRSGAGAGTVLRHVAGPLDVVAVNARWTDARPSDGALWQRQLVLGPQPEWCALGGPPTRARIA